MSEETHPIVDFSNEALEAVFRRAIRNTLILGLVAAVVVVVASADAQERSGGGPLLCAQAHRLCGGDLW